MPTGRAALSVSRGRQSGKPTQQIDNMHALVKQHSTTGQGRVPPPFFFVARPSAVTVAGPHGEDRSEFRQELMGLNQGRMIAMIEAHLENAARIGRQSSQLGGLFQIYSHGLFHQHVQTALKGRLNDLEGITVGGSHHDGVDLIKTLAPVEESSSAQLVGQALPRFGERIAHPGQLGASHPGPSGANKTASDHSNAHAVALVARGRVSLRRGQADSVSLRNTHRWPKVLPTLTPEQEATRDDFMRSWHQKLSGPAYRPIEMFNQGYSVRNRPREFVSTLEIGAGLGEHLLYEKLTSEQRRNYVAVELRENMLDELRRRHPEIQAIQADCQQSLPFPDSSFDRILAIHVLEHLPDLPATVAEMHRLCRPTGTLSVVLPCEGGFLYGLARRISAQSFFERHYRQPYKWLIEHEHISVPAEIISVLERHFRVVQREYFPFIIPSVDLNLCLGLTLQPR